MIQVGGHAATVSDYEIPDRYGLRQTIGDTLGIGGILRALRTIPVMHGIARDMEESAQTRGFSTTRTRWPCSAGPCTPARRSRACRPLPLRSEHHAPLAELLGVPFEEVTFLCAGINHLAFILRFERDGQDLYPLLDAPIERDPELRRTRPLRAVQALRPLPDRVERALRRVRALVHARRRGDRALPAAGRRIRPAQPRDAPGVRGDQGAARGGRPLPIEPSVEYAPQIIHSIETGQPRTIYGNVENAGLIENLPRGACVEVPCLVDANGVEPVHVGELPPQLAALNRTYLNVCELTVRAALEGGPSSSATRRCSTRTPRGRCRWIRSGSSATS